MPEVARDFSSAAVSIPNSTYSLLRYERSVAKSSVQIAKNATKPKTDRTIGTKKQKSIHLKLPLSFGFQPIPLKSAFAKSAPIIGANMHTARQAWNTRRPVIPPTLILTSEPAICRPQARIIVMIRYLITFFLSITSLPFLKCIRALFRTCVCFVLVVLIQTIQPFSRLSRYFREARKRQRKGCLTRSYDCYLKEKLTLFPPTIR